MGILRHRLSWPATAACAALALACGCAGPAASGDKGPPGPTPIAARISSDGQCVTYVQAGRSGPRVITVDIDSGRWLTAAPPPKRWADLAALGFPSPLPPALQDAYVRLLTAEAPHRRITVLGTDADHARVLFAASGGAGPALYFVYDRKSGILYEAGRADAP